MEAPSPSPLAMAFQLPTVQAAPTSLVSSKAFWTRAPDSQIIANPPPMKPSITAGARNALLNSEMFSEGDIPSAPPAIAKMAPPSVAKQNCAPRKANKMSVALRAFSEDARGAPADVVTFSMIGGIRSVPQLGQLMLCGSKAWPQ